MQNTHKPCSGADQKQLPSLPGKRTWTSWALLSVLGLAVATLTGCLAGKYTGGGFINSTAGGGQKATFGFNLEALDRDGDGQADRVVQDVFDPETGELLYSAEWWTAKGQFNYNDHGAGVRFHTGIIETLALDENGQIPGSVGWEIIINFPEGGDPEGFLSAMVFEGPYTSNAGSGRVQLIVTAENDQFGVYLRDSVQVYLTGGPYDGYANAGFIKGGNIQWHPAKTK